MITNNNSLRTELNDNNVLMINNSNTNINNKIKTLQAKNAASRMEL